jgi:hypothetical protein
MSSGIGSAVVVGLGVAVGWVGLVGGDVGLGELAHPVTSNATAPKVTTIFTIPISPD